MNKQTKYQQLKEMTDKIVEQLESSKGNYHLNVLNMCVVEEDGVKPIVLAEVYDDLDDRWQVAAFVDEQGELSEVSDCGLFDSLHGTHTEEMAIKAFIGY